MSDAAILIGTCGWQFEQWQTSYYPESLPEEWQLAYYGNEYPVVLLPAQFWSQSVEVLDNWREELGERPVFIAEWKFCDDAERQTAIREGLASVNDLIIGIVVTLTSLPNASQLQVVRELAQDKPVVLDWPIASAEQYHALQQQLEQDSLLSFCWHGDDAEAVQLEAGQLLLVKVESSGQTPRSLRSLIETVIAKAGERRAVILFDGKPPDLDVVDQAEVILNLL